MCCACLGASSRAGSRLPSSSSSCCPWWPGDVPPPDYRAGLRFPLTGPPTGPRRRPSSLFPQGSARSVSRATPPQGCVYPLGAPPASRHRSWSFPRRYPGFFRASRGSWLAHVNRELGEVAALRAPSTSGVVSSPHLLSSLGGWRGPSWLDARLEKTLRPGGSREPLDPPYFYGSRTSLSKLSIPVLAALRARCGRWCSPARSRSLLLACLALGLYMYI